MEKWVMRIQFCFLSILFSTLASSQNFTNGNFSGSSVGSEFKTGYNKAFSSQNNVITDPSDFIGKSLGANGNYLICTDDVKDFSRKHDNPDSYQPAVGTPITVGKYLIVEPGPKNGNVPGTDATYFDTKGAYNRVKSIVRSETINGFVFDKAYYFQMYAARMLQNVSSAQNKKLSADAQLRMVAKYTILGSSYEEEILSISVNDDLTYSGSNNKSNQFHAHANNYFVARSTTMTIDIELIYPVDFTGKPISDITLAIDELSCGEISTLFRLEKRKYCENETIDTYPVPDSDPINWPNFHNNVIEYRVYKKRYGHLYHYQSLQFFDL